jgi:hypothetical protein
MDKSTLAISSLLLGGGLLAPAMAGTTTEPAPKNPPPVVAAEESPFVTGNLTFTYDTHFISYGQDVWASGMDWSDSLFHPSMELDFNLGGGLQFYVNTWWDVNDLATSSIGGNIQEIDVNAGFYYTLDKWKFQLGYGAWIYGGQTESIIDGRVQYNDGMINPFLMLHGRVDDGIPFDTGLVTQVGIVPSKTFGKVTLALPITVSFDTDNFHGGDAGFAYVSAGLGASIPLIDHLVLNLGVTYYHTSDDVIPGNPDSDFVTGSAGISIVF